MKRLYETIKWQLLEREHDRYDLKRRFNYLITTILIFMASIVCFTIFYSNAQKLNEIGIWIIKLGGVLILVSLFFIIRFGWKLIKELINLLKRQRNWLKYLIIILIFILLWKAYSNKETVLNPLFDVYNKINFTLFMPISIDKVPLENRDFEYTPSNNPELNEFDSFSTPTKIDSIWVSNFMSIVNSERINNGLQLLRESTGLNNIAENRFNKMAENPLISHYGADEYNVGEVVFYPQGYNEQAYVEDIKQKAPLHWNLLMDSMFSEYGYYSGQGQTIVIYGSCASTEIPGPNINVKDFFEKQGCSTEMQTSTWLVIDFD